MSDGTAVAEVGGPGTEVVRSPDPGALMELAIEKGVPVESIERLADLMWRKSERDARAALNVAVTMLQERAGVVHKSQQASIRTKSGGSYGYRYASLDDIRKAIASDLADLGLSYSWDSEMNGPLLRCVCIVSHVDGGEKRSTFECPIDSKADMSGAQRAGAALTYAKRQSLVAALGLTMADEDTDGRSPKQAEAKTVTDEQSAKIKQLLKDADRNVDSFLAWLKCDSVDAMPAHRYDEVRSMLETQVAKNADKAKAAKGAS